MSVAGLFAGIGGMELGLKVAGFRPLLFAEWDPCAVAVLRAHFPEASFMGDVANLTRLPPETTVITAGFPCQDLSPPGGKVGIDGSRSGLIFHVFRLAAATPSVEWIILENVHFMLKLDAGRAMGRIVSALEDLGWNWAYRTLDPICVVPQRRRRVIVVASPRHDPRDVLFSDDYPGVDEREPAPGDAMGFYWTEGRSGSGLRREAIPTLKIGSGLGIASAPAVLLGDGRLGTPSIGDAERLQGLPVNWTIAAEGMARNVRWRLVGNAVPPLIAEWVARGIQAPRGVDRSVRFAPLAAHSPWPDAASGIRGQRTAALIGESFSGQVRPLLSGFLRDALIPLSSRAVRGFVSRARGGGMRWPEGFLDKVEAHA
jgi:DNA (cytosine-5)-methyltransferase 1